jgi:hypothetical protein
MAISNLLPTGGANDNRPNLKQFFGKNPAVANDNVERVSSGMFTNTFMDSVVTTLHGLVDAFKNITDIAKNVITSFGAIVKSLKSLNKEITSRFRVLNNDLNASKIDFIKAVLAIPKTNAPVKIDGIPVNVNQQETLKKEDDKSGLFDSLMVAWVVKNLGSAAIGILKSLIGAAGTLVSMAASIIKLGLLDKIPALLALLAKFALSPAGIALMAGTGFVLLAYKGLEELTKAIMESPGFEALMKRSQGKTDLEETTAAGIEAGQKLKGRPDLRQGFKGRNEAFYEEPGNSWGEGGSKLKVSDFKNFPKNMFGEEIGILKNKLKDGTVAINIQTGQRYGTIDADASVQGDVKVGQPIGAPTIAAAGAQMPGDPARAAGSQTAAPAAPAALGATGAGSFSLGGPTGGPSAAPAGAGAPVVSATPTAAEPPENEPTNTEPGAGAPSLKPSTGSAIPVPGASPSAENSTGPGVSVTNTSVQNIGKVRGAETNGMTGQNLPMFARNKELDKIWGKQQLQHHQ